MIKHSVVTGLWHDETWRRTSSIIILGWLSYSRTTVLRRWINPDHQNGSDLLPPPIDLHNAGHPSSKYGIKLNLHTMERHLGLNLIHASTWCQKVPWATKLNLGKWYSTSFSTVSPLHKLNLATFSTCLVHGLSMSMWKQSLWYF